jgi:1,4-dihydroxy-2-naphthoate octaprenyltransferase
MSTAITPDIAPGSLDAWLVALRPRSLLIAVSPVVVGTALAWQRLGSVNWLFVLLTLAAAVALQIITNLQNDVGYTVRGAERHGTRTGLPRATAHGWLRVIDVRIAIVGTIVASLALGLPLVMKWGWPVIAMGMPSILAALAYMGGPRPIAYTPFGELVVFVFFGLIAVPGTEFVLTGSVGLPSWLAAPALGGLAVAAMVINNHRDAEHDRGTGRRTLAVVFGTGTTRLLYQIALLMPFALVPAIAWSAAALPLLLPLALLPAAMHLRRDFLSCPPGLPFNLVLFRTFKMELAFALLLAGGAVLGRVLAT